MVSACRAYENHQECVRVGVRPWLPGESLIPGTRTASKSAARQPLDNTMQVVLGPAERCNARSTPFSPKMPGKGDEGPDLNTLVMESCFNSDLFQALEQ